jgi:hypothetical protein
MADNEQKKESKRQRERLVPSIIYSSSRVSGAAGTVGSLRGQNKRNDQRSKASRSGQGTKSNGRGQSSANSPQTPKGKQGQGSKKNPTPGRSSSSSSNNTPEETRDAQAIKWMQNKWNNLEPHHQQRIYGTLLLGLSLLLFASLTIFRSTPVLTWFYKFFTAFFGWSAYLLALGLVAFALAHLIEGIRNQTFIRWSMVIGLFAIWLLLLVESRLLF